MAALACSCRMMAAQKQCTDAVRSSSRLEFVLGAKELGKQLTELCRAFKRYLVTCYSLKQTLKPQVT